MNSLPLSLQHVIRHIDAVLREIGRLREHEFPLHDSKIALDKIEEGFRTRKFYLQLIDRNTPQDDIELQCVTTLRHIGEFLPLLGFIANSTTLRNPFEFHGPLRRLARHILAPFGTLSPPDIHVILSAEWEYSPFTYSGVYDDDEVEELRGFILIGLPASESCNALLLPLAGHELGHVVWSQLRRTKDLEGEIRERLKATLHDKWDEYETAFRPSWSKQEVSLTEDDSSEIQETWAPAWAFAKRQVEESFCDFIGVGVFGLAYLHAFAYLLAPNVVFERPLFYPQLRLRAENVVRAAKKFEVCPRDSYADLFSESPLPRLTERDKFQVDVADAVLGRMVDPLICLAVKTLEQSVDARASARTVGEVVTCYRHLVPATGLPSLSYILNAAWNAFHDPDLWKEYDEISKNRDDVLNELVLKNIEILEIESIMKEHRMIGTNLEGMGSL